ncbi:MAG: large conductance mechanosensitive channel protein MscL, partial [Firmicutes bacterium]|nr:large conductance mechanosensitive channel protein MscL [Bacillota bacterium]
MGKEFKEFINKGNVMNLAVGMIIGAAFTAIVKSLVDDIIMPVIGLLFGKVDFTNLFVTLDGSKYATLAEAKEAGAAVLAYGSFIMAIINFLLIAVVVFCLVKAVNKAQEAVKKEEKE